jgi:hypothetical protein
MLLLIGPENKDLVELVPGLDISDIPGERKILEQTVRYITFLRGKLGENVEKLDQEFFSLTQM